jgi:hypothetical protein
MRTSTARVSSAPAEAQSSFFPVSEDLIAPRACQCALKVKVTVNVVRLVDATRRVPPCHDPVTNGDVALHGTSIVAPPSTSAS